MTCKHKSPTPAQCRACLADAVLVAQEYGYRAGLCKALQIVKDTPIDVAVDKQDIEEAVQREIDRITKP